MNRRKGPTQTAATDGQRGGAQAAEPGRHGRNHDEIASFEHPTSLDNMGISPETWIMNTKGSDSTSSPARTTRGGIDVLFRWISAYIASYETYYLGSSKVQHIPLP